MDFVSIFVLGVSGVIVSMYYQKQKGDVDLVESLVDNNKYLVRNLPDKKDAADSMAYIKKNLDDLVKHLEAKYPSDDRIQRLIMNFGSAKISETTPGSKYTSYSVNKGEELVFCIREKNMGEKIHSKNTIMFVALHELAHTMTQSIGHTEEFWDNFRFLLKEAIAKGIYKYKNYKEEPEAYCGISITDTPLKDNIPEHTEDIETFESF